MAEKSDYQLMREQKEKEAWKLAREVRDALADFASTLPYVASVSKNHWSSYREEFTAYDKNMDVLCKGSVKVSQDWRKSDLSFAVYASVAGGWAGRSHSGTRSQTYRVTSPEKLDGPKAKLAKAADATWRYDRDSKAADRERKSVGRENARIFKAAGYKVATASGYDIEDDAEDDRDWMYATEIVGEKDGLRIGLKANGELLVRLPATMTFEDFLKKLG